LHCTRKLAQQTENKDRAPPPPSEHFLSSSLPISEYSEKSCIVSQTYQCFLQLLRSSIDALICHLFLPLSPPCHLSALPPLRPATSAISANSATSAPSAKMGLTCGLLSRVLCGFQKKEPKIERPVRGSCATASSISSTGVVEIFKPGYQPPFKAPTPRPRRGARKRARITPTQAFEADLDALCDGFVSMRCSSWDTVYCSSSE
jgi:hypothetical protein